ncbi:hypothetical protein [Saccharothrix sp. CB00851]|uniref:hypothetical protein n=1 Tax=Saccharothrix sp. CB00851 TaxID=1835005 RepID=UPI0018E914C7
MVSGVQELVLMSPLRHAYSSPLTGANESPHSHHSLRLCALTTIGASMPPLTTPVV